jgi:hypothetical protein
MADLTYYDDLDKGIYMQAKQLLLLAAIARGVKAHEIGDADVTKVIISSEDGARAILAKLADQAFTRRTQATLRDKAR